MTPFSPSNDDRFLSPNSRSTSFRYYDANETNFTPAHRPTPLSMISPAPSIPNIFDQNGTAPLQLNPLPQHSPPQVVGVQRPPSPLIATDTVMETDDAATADRTETDQAAAVDGMETDEAPTLDEADEDAGIADPSVAQFLPTAGNGEPIEEAPVTPGRTFCERQCMWIAMAWYRATEDSERGANMTAATFQQKMEVLYNAFRLEHIEETASVGELSREYLELCYKERFGKNIYTKWLSIQRYVLDFIAYKKTRGNRPSGYPSDEDWMKVVRASYVDLKNARFKAAKKRDKFNCPGLLSLHDFLM